MPRQTWVATGISGSGRIELLEEVRKAAADAGHSVIVHDVGALLREEFKKNSLLFTDQKILDADPSLLRIARASVINCIQVSMLRNPETECHLVGVHATFRWKDRLIPGISHQDLLGLQPDGFLNVVDEVSAIHARNGQNPKWHRDSLPNLQATQEWMVEEEFVTEVYAEVFRRPVFLVAADHTPANLVDLFFSKKRRLYLSFPITAVQRENPELIQQVQGPILERLQKNFVVFNPWWIEDMALLTTPDLEGLPVEQLTPAAVEIVKKRTIERDFQFIDQADGVVVFYLTDKVSPGVLAEIYYAHRMQKPVFMVFPGNRSPFLEAAVAVIEPNVSDLLDRLEHQLAGT